MAWYKTGGGSQELQETVLWTNSSPTSSWTATNVTLNDSVENYIYLRFTYRVSTSDATQYDVICDVETLKKAISAVPAYRPYLGAHTTSSTNHIRTVIYVDTTTIQLAGAATTTGTGANGYCIPTAIVGLKYATPKPSGTETILWTNSSPTSNFANQTITLSEIFTNFKYVKFVGRVSTTDNTETLAIYPTDFVKKWNQGTADGRGALDVASGGYSYLRNIYIATADIGNYNKVSFDSTYRLASTSSQNNYVIPTQIIGIS